MAKRKEKIICVKIAQHKLRHPDHKLSYDYFPYDRVYLAPKKLAPIFRKTFRYYLSMSLNKDLLQALNSLNVNSTRESPVVRDNYRRAKTPGHTHDNFKSLIRSPKGWILVVPTHVRSLYRNPKKYKNPYASRVRYLISKAIQRGHNLNVRMPRITFYTPNRVIPVLCAVCKNLPKYHANTCSPGTHTCQQNVESELPLDSEFYLNSQRSTQETGGEA